MRTIAQLIKLGLEDFFEGGRDPYMCLVLYDLANPEDDEVAPLLTREELNSFKQWIANKYRIRDSDSVLSLLVRNGFKDSDENWVQFYVWAYYDLVKGDHHEHQP
ncbi:hypothetical protein [Pseudomonas phage vB_Pae-PA14]|nr:hypothetical protein [Pseudomonas phage vB_Pae-PA14]